MTYVLPIWPGSSSFFPGDTPFGFYDHDLKFQEDIEKTADWVARRLGYGLSDVELQDRHIFAAFEESVFEYSSIINASSAKDNLGSLIGLNSSSLSPEAVYLPSSFNGIVKLARNYGNHLGVSALTYYTGSIALKPGKQIYSFVNTNDVSFESGSISTEITIRKIFHTHYNGRQPTTQFPIENEFGWNTNGSTYLLLPFVDDVLDAQYADYDQQIRRSSYSFQLTNKRLRIFPIPKNEGKLWFHYTVDSEEANNSFVSPEQLGRPGLITNLANAPYFNIAYGTINEIGKVWIRKFTLAVCKEVLGLIRGKYSSLPIPDGEVTLNADDLISSGREEQTNLKTELNDMLNQMTRESQMQKKASEADNLFNQLKYHPNKIYVR